MITIEIKGNKEELKIALEKINKSFDIKEIDFPIINNNTLLIQANVNKKSTFYNKIKEPKTKNKN